MSTTSCGTASAANCANFVHDELRICWIMYGLVITILEKVCLAS